MTMNDRPILLLVDDEPLVHLALRRVFRNEPYEVRTAESAILGLEVISSGIPIRAVISDYRMPVMNGVDFLKEVYARSPETVRIILSGFTDRPILLEAVQEGRIYKYLPKPWDDDLLRSTVRKGIEQTAAAWEKREQIKSLITENADLQKRVIEPTSGAANRADFVQRMTRMLSTSQNISDDQGPGILCVGSDGIILICNESAAASLKMDSQLLIGSASSQILGDGLNGFIRELLSCETVGSLHYQEGKLSMRGMRLTYANDDCSALIFI
jgi:two-component system, NtrC family, sensor kinase